MRGDTKEKLKDMQDKISSIYINGTFRREKNEQTGDVIVRRG